MSKRKVAPVKMWAPLITGSRASWVQHNCIAHTRKAAKKAYLDAWEPQHHDEMLKDVRFVKVVVTVAEGQE